MLELQGIREELTEKTKAILDMHESIRKKEEEIGECRKETTKLEVWQERTAIWTNIIDKQAKQIDDLKKHAKSLFTREAGRFGREIERLKKEIVAEKAKTLDDVSELEKNVQRSKLERNCRLALHDLSKLKERVWMGEHIKKELESTNMKLKRLETVEELYDQVQSKLEDIQQTMNDWRNSVQRFFGKEEELKTPVDAKLRFMVYQQEMLVEAASPESLLALEEKGKKDEAVMAKLQGRILELTKALQRNAKIVEQERAKVREATKLQQKAESKRKLLQKEVDKLTKVERMEDNLVGLVIDLTS